MVKIELKNIKMYILQFIMELIGYQISFKKLIMFMNLMLVQNIIIDISPNPQLKIKNILYFKL